MKDTAHICPSWVDFHCHLDLYKDHGTLISECDQAAVATLAVTTTPKAWPRNRDMALNSSHVRVALGLHPQLVAEREAELALFHRYLPETRYVGEVGLDASPRFYGSFEAQERVFEAVLRGCAEHGDKILSIHSLRCVSKVLSHIERNLPADRGRTVLHWFTGTMAESRRAVDLGCYFSINAEMVKSPRHRAIIATLPLERLLTETDGPFTESEGRPSRPRDVTLAVRDLASVLNLEVGEIGQKIISNLASLVSIQR